MELNTKSSVIDQDSSKTTNQNIPRMHSLVIDLENDLHPSNDSEFAEFGERCQRKFESALKDLKNEARQTFGAVHGLTFPADMPTHIKLALNQKLAECYQKFEVPVLGGDTSNGPRFQVVVTLLSQSIPDQFN